MVNYKWQPEINTKVIGKEAKRMEQVCIYINIGLYIFANGDIYEGEFENGNRQGQGTYTWTDQSYYKGEWLADKMNGKGVYANSDI
jgi:hypothetical protein